MALGSGFGADLPGRIHLALLLNCGGQIRDGHAQFCKLIGLHPDAHSIVGGTKIRNLPYTRNAKNRIVHVDGGVVSQELPSVRAVCGVQGDDEKRQTHQLFDRETVLGNRGGQVRAGL